MKITPTEIDDLFVIEPKCFRDHRGHFYESYQRDAFVEAGIKVDFIQDNLSKSQKHTLRGMHFQVKRPQAQLVTIVSGEVMDVVVDLRPQSKTFKQWKSFELNENAPKQIYMGPGLAHGFYVKSDTAILHYKVTRFYDSDDEGGLHWKDPDIAIDWPTETPIISEKDDRFPFLSDIDVNKLPHETNS